MKIVLLIIAACLLVLTEGRRVQARPRVTEPQVYYEDEDGEAVEDDYSPSAYQPRTRALPSPRSKDTAHTSKPPPVQTIRNYNKVNDDGSFTFGYEAADGSFKEETRGTDCVVRGKYGYVDPDGNKREFTYVSGNPCDPNAPKEDDDLPKKQEEEEASGPANYPSVRPVPRPLRPQNPTYSQTTTRAPTTIFQTQYQLDDDASQELENPVRTQPRPVPTAFRRPQQQYVQAAQSPTFYQPAPTPRPSTTSAPQYQSPTTFSAASYRTQPTVPTTAYRPIEPSSFSAAQHRPQSVAITPRPHAAQVAAQYASPSSNTERPGVVFAPHPSSAAPLPRGTASAKPQLDFAAELERYVNNVGVTSRPAASGRVKAAHSADPIYQSELVFDPATGQYNTQLYQTLPQTVGDFSLSHKLQPFVAQPQSLLSLQTQSQLYHRQPASAQSAPAPKLAQRPQEAIFRQQQADLLQQSQQLFAQQQRRQQQPHRFQLLDSQRDAQPFYYVAPAESGGASSPLSVGQIDQFLRGSAAGF